MKPSPLWIFLQVNYYNITNCYHLASIYNVMGNSFITFKKPIDSINTLILYLWKLRPRKVTSFTQGLWQRYVRAKLLNFIPPDSKARAFTGYYKDPGHLPVLCALKVLWCLWIVYVLWAYFCHHLDLNLLKSWNCIKLFYTSFEMHKKYIL